MVYSSTHNRKTYYEGKKIKVKAGREAEKSKG
jgi:hypothetical protein